MGSIKGNVANDFTHSLQSIWGCYDGSYYKVSTTTQGIIKVVDPKTYKPSLGEKAKIIYKLKE